MRLQTKRLELIPYSPEIIEAAINDKSRIESLLNLKVPEDWPWEEVLDAFPVFAELASDPTQQNWGAWLIIHSLDKTIIGDLGFGGKPDEQGKVEMGYNIIPNYRNQGYGFEAVQALVNWAITQPNLKKIVATCPADNLPSIRILEKLGMHCVEKTPALLTWEKGV
ncbi:GNAT family N-acetyltransferase [Capilliphycus salinus ALCB114379]|uniref:GNAT family N-acetyltransferase n=1 Tax=Capilliphycus salinus TaxID=2768948 RepID=UPI0039A76A94